MGTARQSDISGNNRSNDVLLYARFAASDLFWENNHCCLNPGKQAKSKNSSVTKIIRELKAEKKKLLTLQSEQRKELSSL